MELLRQHVPSMDDARSLLATTAMLDASAHSGMTCTDCHEGIARYPHGDDAPRPTCAECHQDVESEWAGGAHAEDGNAECASCHGVHEVLPVETLHTVEGARYIQGACSSCHFDPQMPAEDPHSDSVSCAGCHEPHRTLSPEDESSTVHVMRQAETCGGCHDTVASTWLEDSHAAAVPELAMPGGRVPEGSSRAEPPACTGCHGAHGMLTPAAPAFGREMVERCAHCHEEYAESFADSYHGQATTLGSQATATCHDCHMAHTVYPEHDARSSVSEANLLATCQTCHPEATAGFALFQPHADHNDKEEYPYVYWSYHLMTLLLLTTFSVFGAHTALWLIRLGVDAIKGPGSTAHPTGD